MKNALLMSLLVSMLTCSFNVSTFASPETYGPRTDYLICDISYDAATQWMKLKGGAIDFMQSPLTKPMIDEAKTLPGIATAPYTSIDMYQFDLNCQRWPTDDVRFRRALAYLVNKPAIILDCLKGLGARMDTVIPPGFLSPYIASDVSYPNYPYEYNPTIAQQILTDAGYLPWNPAWPKLLFWTRLDDPRRVAASNMLRDELVNMGVAVDYRPAHRSVCFPNVMVQFNFNIYSGDWVLSRDVDYVHDLYTPEFYRPRWPNYVGFINPDFEYEADKLKFAPDAATVTDSVKKCQKIMISEMPVIPLWCDVSKKAYRAGFEDAVNQEGVGKDNWWTFFDTYYSPDPSKRFMVYGLGSDIDELNVVTAQMPLDLKVLGLIYDTLIHVDPYSLPIDLNCGMARSWEVSTWIDPDDGLTKSKAIFHMPPEGTIKWHPFQNGAPLNPPYVTVDDIKFSFQYHYDQEGWYYPYVMDIKVSPDLTLKIETPDAQTVEVYFDVLSYWALHWAGSVPIIPKQIWSTVPDAYTYDPIAEGTVVGCGPWRFNRRVVGVYILLDAFRDYFLTADYASEITKEAFHRLGDVDYDGIVCQKDWDMVAEKLSASPYSPAPIYTVAETEAWDPLTPSKYPLTTSLRIAGGWIPEDIDCDGKVYAKDLYIIGTNYGKTADGIFIPERAIEKTLSPTEGRLGDVVHVTLNVRVPKGETATVVDTLPRSFHYLVGSYAVDGVSATPIIDEHNIIYTVTESGTHVIEFGVKVDEAKTWEDHTVTNKATATWYDELGNIVEQMGATADFVIHAFQQLHKTTTESLTIKEKTNVQWTVTFEVTNPFSYTMTNVVITDRFGAEIEIDKKFPYRITQGKASYTLEGTTQQVHLTWNIGKLRPGQTAKLMILVSTDINPAGQQEYTTPGIYELNSGATLKFIDPEQNMQLSAVTAPIYVTVLPAELTLSLSIPYTARVVNYDNGIYVVGTTAGELYVIDETGQYTTVQLARSINDVRIENGFIAVATEEEVIRLELPLGSLTPVESWRRYVGRWVASVDISGDGNYVAYLCNTNVGVLGIDGSPVASYSIAGAAVICWLDATDDMEYIAITAEVGPPEADYGGTNTGVEVYRFDGTSLQKTWGRVLIYQYETTEVRVSEDKRFVAAATSSGTEMNSMNLTTGEVLWRYDAGAEQFACDGDDNLDYVIGGTITSNFKYFILRNYGSNYELALEGSMSGAIDDLDSTPDGSCFAFGSDAGEFILSKREDAMTFATVLAGKVGRIDAIEIGSSSLLVGGDYFINLYTIA